MEIVIALKDNGLQQTEIGLTLAITKIPAKVRKIFKQPAFSWYGKAGDWLLVKISEASELGENT